MKRFAWILPVAGILALAWFARLRDSTAPQPAQPAESAQPAADIVGESPTTIANEREAVVLGIDAEQVEPEPRSQLVVCVVDDASGAPVPGARVALGDTAGLMETLRLNNTTSDAPAGRRIRSKLEVVTTAGADGCAEFARTPAHATIEARADERFGFAVLNVMPADHRMTVRVTNDVSVRVRVVDANGEPLAGVPVALRKPGQQPRRFDWKATESEAPDGVATFFHYQRRLLQGSGWRFALAFPVAEDPTAEVDPTASDSALPQLVRPDVGSLRIHVRDANGEVPPIDRLSLRLRAFDEAAGGAERWPGGPWSTPRLHEDGDALAPWLGLGLRLEVQLFSYDSPRGETSVAGPARAGETVECEVRALGKARQTVWGRFVFADGSAWPSASAYVATLTFPPRPDGPQGQPLEIDAAGRFRFELVEAASVGGSRELQFGAPHPRIGARVLASVALDREVPADGLDLGDVVLDHGAPLAAGRVVDENGQPLAGATFELRLAATTETSGVKPTTSQRGPPRLGTSLGARSGDDGSFALYGARADEHPRGTPLLLTTSHRGHVTEPVREIALGVSGLEVVLARAGEIEGSLDLCAGLAYTDLELSLSSADGRKQSVRPWEANFRFGSLTAGVYSLSVRRSAVRGRADERPLAEVDGLQVVPGEVCRDPRIQHLRIEDGRLVVKLRVVDESSAPVSGAWLLVAGVSSARPPSSDEDGTCVLRLERLPVDVEVGAAGYRPRLVRGLAADDTVVLENGIAVRLHTDARPFGLAPRYLLRLELFEVDAAGARGAPTVRANLGRWHDFDAGGALALRVPGPGTYECAPMMTVLAAGGASGGPVELAEYPRITVLDRPGEQRFELDIPQAAVDAAVAKYSR